MAGKNRQKHTSDLLKQAELDELHGIISELQNTGQDVLLAALNTEITDAKKKAAVAQVQQAAVVADGKVKTWLVPAVSGAYVSGVNALHRELGKFSFKTRLGKITVETLRGVPEMQPHLAAVNSLLSDAYLDFGSGMTGYVRGAEHALNDALKRQVQQKLGVGRLTGTDIRTIKKEIAANLKDKGFNVLLDRGGKQWSLNTYSEMLARTHVIKANTEATVNRGQELGIDIYEVSTHGADDHLCSPHEGAKYSKSGKSKNYPALGSANTPPFHPNCKHTLLPRPDLE